MSKSIRKGIAAAALATMLATNPVMASVQNNTPIVKQVESNDIRIAMSNYSEYKDAYTEAELADFIKEIRANMTKPKESLPQDYIETTIEGLKIKYYHGAVAMHISNMNAYAAAEAIMKELAGYDGFVGVRAMIAEELDANMKTGSGSGIAYLNGKDHEVINIGVFENNTKISMSYRPGNAYGYNNKYGTDTSTTIYTTDNECINWYKSLDPATGQKYINQLSKYL